MENKQDAADAQYTHVRLALLTCLNCSTAVTAHSATIVTRQGNKKTRPSIHVSPCPWAVPITAAPEL